MLRLGPAFAKLWSQAPKCGGLHIWGDLLSAASRLGRSIPAASCIEHLSLQITCLQWLGLETSSRRWGVGPCLVPQADGGWAAE